MDVFKIDQSLSGNLGRAPSPDKINVPELTFEAGSEFNLCFFDTPEDTQGFSDPSSVGSTTNGSPPPQQLTPLHITLAGSNPIQSPVLLSPPGGQNPSITIKQEHYVAADSNSSSTTKASAPCRVCGDKSSGYHYGVTSCEGCKGFFRRSIQKQIEYRCLRDGKCLVIRLNRNRCQYCRFKKCISVGMSRDSVRYGRVPKRSREMSADEPPKVTISDADQSDSETKQLAVYEVILTVSQAHHANCGYTEEHTKTLVRRPIVLPPASPQPDRGAASSTAEALELERVRLWQEFAARITPSVQRLVEFAKRLPGFFDLCQDDQLILIKLGFFEIWLCHAARLAAGSAPVVFDDGAAVSKQQLEILYDSEFASAVIHFTNAFNALSLNDTEVGLLSAVVLFTADRSGTTDIKLIEHQRDKLIEALKVQVGRNHASKPQIFSNMLILIPELRNLGSKHLAHLNWLRVNMEKIVLPPLFVEIFDIRNHDELQ